MNQLTILAIAVAIAFSLGWTTKTWQSDSVQLAIDKAAAMFTIEAKSREEAAALAVQQALREGVVHERIIEKRLQPIIRREVYKQDCIDTDGLAVINSLLLRETTTDDNASEPSREMP